MDNIYKNNEIKIEEIYSTIFEAAPIGIANISLDGKFFQVNCKFCDILGYDRKELLSMRFCDITSTEELSACENGSYNIEANDDLTFNKIKRYISKSESIVWVEFFSKVIADIHGKPAYFIVMINDVTEKKNIEERFMESEERFKNLFDQAPLGYQSLDEEGKFIEINQKWLDMMGYERSEIIGKCFGDFVVPAHKDSFFERFPVFKEKGYIRSKFSMLTKNGDEILIAFDGRIGFDDKGEFRQTHCILKDITNEQKLENELIYLSYHDQLTGLYNRRFYEEELIRLDKEDNLPLSLIMADANGLKLANDAFGHKKGDDILKLIAHILKKECEADDIISRIGGDEFVILLPKTDSTRAQVLIERINDAVSREVINEAFLSISIGYGVKEKNSDLMTAVFKIAEDDMYRHKLAESSSMRSNGIDLIMNSLYEKSNREMLHSKRVSHICEAIAFNMGFKKEDIKNIKLAGLVHDIGKIGIGNIILDKKGRLTEDEWVEIKKHSESGYRILITVNEFSEIAGFILSHHEKWDGNGYPQGLKGEEIPIQARIITVADAFDAMTSDRTYRMGMSEEKALEELEKYSAIQFDPEIVNVFIEKVMRK